MRLACRLHCEFPAIFNMAGVVLETISNKQLILFTLVLFGVQIMFFIIGGTLGKLECFTIYDAGHRMNSNTEYLQQCLLTE